MINHICKNMYHVTKAEKELAEIAMRGGGLADHHLVS